MKPSLRDKRLRSCVSIASLAEKEGLPATEVAAIGYVESRYDSHRTSRAGARGVLQVIPKYWCPKRGRAGCDYSIAGLRAWRTYRKRGLTEGLCRYSTGKPCRMTSGGRRYARKVTRNLNVAKRQFSSGRCGLAEKVSLVIGSALMSIF